MYKLTPEHLLTLQNFVLLPSKLNAQSLITNMSMTNEDPHKLMKYLLEQVELSQDDPDKIVILDDQEGNILERFKENLLQVPR